MVVGVKFKDTDKCVYFNSNGIEIKKDDYVIVPSDNGALFGKVFSINNEEINNEIKNVVRVASKKDYDIYLKNLANAKEALDFAKASAKNLGLRMQFVDSSFNFERSQLLINFVSEERIDFRELVKILAGKYKTRIELHQIGIRDKAKKISGLGPCGRPLCCGSFLNELEAVGINMAKNQNIALNPSKINGACGRLLCCLAYEDENYSYYRSLLPKIGSEVIYEGKKYKVLTVNVLKMSYVINVDGELKEIVVDNYERN